MTDQNTEAQYIINALTQQRDVNANAAAGAMARISYLEQELASAQRNMSIAVATIAELNGKLATAATSLPAAD